MTDALTPPEAWGQRPAVPVLRPLLPTADRLLPYLQRMDATRTYANWGPLVLEFEARVAGRLGLPPDAVVSAASGTAAIIGAVLAVAGRATRERPLALLPGYTFVASAVAAEQCGYEPVVLDVDAGTWGLDPADVMAHPDLSRVGLVVPVAPFGRAIDQERWAELHRQTGIPVVIDAAASFDRLDAAEGGPLVGPVPMALSFHATKAFAVGEGGAVVCSDAELVHACGRALNFGFFEDRVSRGVASNGKMSELHAAVGLAELDGWDGKLAALQDVAQRYRSAFGRVGLEDRLAIVPDVSASYVLVRAEDEDEAVTLRAALSAARIDHRLWYAGGLRSHPHFGPASRTGTPVSDALAATTIGLPHAPDLDDRSIALVTEAIAEGVRR